MKIKAIAPTLTTPPKRVLPLGPANPDWSPTADYFWNQPNQVFLKDYTNLYGFNPPEIWHDGSIHRDLRLARIRSEFDHIEGLYFNRQRDEFVDTTMFLGAVFYSKVATADRCQSVQQYIQDMTNEATFVGRNMGYNHFNNDIKKSALMTALILSHIAFRYQFSIPIPALVTSCVGMLIGTSYLFDFLDLRLALKRSSYIPGQTQSKSLLERVFGPRQHANIIMSRILNAQDYYKGNPTLYTQDSLELLNHIIRLCYDAVVLENEFGDPGSPESFERIQRAKNLEKFAKRQRELVRPVPTLVHEEEGAVSIAGSEDLRGRVSLVDNQKGETS